MNMYTPEELDMLIQMVSEIPNSLDLCAVLRGTPYDGIYSELPKKCLTPMELKKLWTKNKTIAIITHNNKKHFLNYAFLRQVMFEYPLRALPPLINHPIMGVIVRWRCMLGK